MIVFSLKFFFTCLILTCMGVIISEVVWKGKTDKMPQWWLVIFSTIAILSFLTFFGTGLIAVWTL